MSYIALYRKYRPSTFESIVGQENVTKILRNQIKSEKISHAYIFSGSRGTGKTSAAKVFARAINCLNPKDGEPCNECEICKSILDSNTTDVVEMDAASNNSVENIRQIRQEVVYATVDVKYRVYIIDEVHMLTTSAFNALLKTLEEPPENVVFILATTEQHKIPVTILSRCLRFEFNRIPDEDIIKRLEYVLKEENMEYEAEAITFIAKLAEGGLRDALSILDRCISETSNKLKYQDVVKIVGGVDREIVDKIVNGIIDVDTNLVIDNIDKIVDKGKDLRQLNYQLIEKFLDLLVNDNQNKKNVYIKIIDRLSKLDNDLRLTSKPSIILKSTIIEICNYSYGVSASEGNSSNTDISPLVQKISNLQMEIESLKNKMNSMSQIASSQNFAKNGKTVNNVDNNEVKSENINKDVDKSNLVKFSDSENFKKKIIENGKLKLYSSLANSDIYTCDDLLVIITNNSFAYSILVSKENIKELKDIFFQSYGENRNIVIKLEELNEDSTLKIEKVFKENDINYTNID